jgi:transposase-like protein
MATRVWTNNWDELSEYFQFTDEIRAVIYTTNAIESYNSILRKYLKNKRSFPTNESLLKLLFLADSKACEK